MERVRLAVVGAGISGLAAAWRATSDPAGDGGPAAGPDEVIVLESSPRTGGKLLTGQLQGPGGAPISVDLGAESTLARRPEAVDLIAEAGLPDDLVHPAVASASVLARGRLYAMPGGTVMGVPNDPASLRGLLDDAGVARAAAEPSIPAAGLDHDIDVASWVSQRFGQAVSDRLVEPLLGGVYAGHADRLSLQATIPALWPLAQAGGSVLGRLPGAQSAPGTPVFAGVRGGLGRLADVLRTGLEARGVRIRTHCTVRDLQRLQNGWRLETGPAPAPVQLLADQVIVAVPPPAAARLLRRECLAAAVELADIPMASVAVIVAVLPAVQAAGLTGSGVLVPPIEGHLIKAATFSSAKWSWVGEQAASQDCVLIRISVGRAGEEQDLQLPDDALAAAAVHDLGLVLRRTLAPTAVLVQRWGGGLPQYQVGHIDRVRRIRSSIAAAGGLAICGAALDGVGIPACIASAGRAVADLAAARSAQQGRIGA